MVEEPDRPPLGKQVLGHVLPDDPNEALSLTGGSDPERYKDLDSEELRPETWAAYETLCWDLGLRDVDGSAVTDAMDYGRTPCTILSPT